MTEDVRAVRRASVVRVAAVACATVLLGGSILACGERSQQDVRTVRIGFTRYVTMSPVFISKAAGFFEEQGLDVELVQMQSAAASIPALVQGQLDVLPGPVSPSMFNAIHRGARIRLVSDKGAYARTGCAHQAFVVSPEIARAGGRVAPKKAVQGREPFMQFVAERSLTHLGFDPSHVELSFVPQVARYNAILAGRLDGGILSEPLLSQFRKADGHVWLEIRDLLAGHQLSVYAFGPRLLEEDPELGQRVAVALLKGIRQYNLGKTPENLRILAEALDWDRDLLEDVCWPSMRSDGQINTESILEFQEWSLDRGLLDAIVPAEDYWNPTFMEHARRVVRSSP